MSVSYRIPSGGTPRIYGMAAGFNTVLTVHIGGCGSAVMTGSSGFLVDQQGQQVHWFPPIPNSAVASIQMSVGGNPIRLQIVQTDARSIKLGQAGGDDKVVLAW